MDNRKLVLVSLLGAVVLSSCAGHDDGPDCDPLDHIGQFQMTWTERNGDCGPVPAEVIMIENPYGVPAGCVLDAADVWSTDSCELDRHYTCDDSDTDATVLVHFSTAVVESDPDTFTGSASVTVEICDPGGCASCSSTYGIRFDRI